MHWEGWSVFAAYLGGIVVTSILVILTGVWLGEIGRSQEKRRLALRFKNEKIPVGCDTDIFVGFAPGPYPRIYGTRYHWDAGFFIFSKDRMHFVGEQIKFSFKRSEIDAVAVCRGGPSWWKFERVYMSWRIEDGRNGIFNLNSLEPGPIWRSRLRVRTLYRQIEEWRLQAAQYPEVHPKLADVKALELGQVTSISPRTLGTLKVNLRVGAYLLLCALALSMATQAELWYMSLSVAVVRMIQSIPYWRYRDVVPAFSPTSDNPSKARMASAAVGSQ